jgi:S-adenosylmethionine:tRNA ribosyltransferase-isomerase
MLTSDFDYELPPELIAQTPIEPRDSSRLLVLDRQDGSIAHRRFTDILEFLRDGDVMVFNDSRVLPARLKGKREGSGGAVEVLLLRRLEANLWESLVKPAKRLLVGSKIEIQSENSSGEKIIAEISALGAEGIRTVRFADETLLFNAGKMPLPPYIHEPLKNPERYQTVYSKVIGSAAAPTAGLHFTPELLRQLPSKGVKCVFTTLHVGLDTFRPVMEDDPEKHVIHGEYGVIDNEAAAAITKAKKEGRRVICVGTTSTRLAEQAALASATDEIQPYAGWVNLFILPGHKYKAADALMTNFHLPKSTLLMLVSAFASKELIFKAYREAVAQKYRFYSFGDAMLIL